MGMLSSISVQLTRIEFGGRSGVQAIKAEEGDVISVSYGFETFARASFTVQGGGLDQSFTFDLNVPLGSEGASGVVDRAKKKACDFLAALAHVAVRCE